MHLIAKVIKNDKINRNCRHLVVHAPEIVEKAMPGQFVHVLCSSSCDPLLRRPLGINDLDIQAGTFSMLYEIRGKGTKLLAERCAGETLDIIGPLGNGFTMPKSPHCNVLIIAGGFGAAPLYYLAKELSNTQKSGSITVILGASTSEMLLMPDAFRKLTADVRIATDDGSEGCCGFATIPMAEYVQEYDNSLPLIIYACGPTPMLKSIAEFSNEHELSCQISSEAKMACGVGACMGCVIKVKDNTSENTDLFKYVRSCKEGPVFDAKEVIW